MIMYLFDNMYGIYILIYVSFYVMFTNILMWYPAYLHLVAISNDSEGTRGCAAGEPIPSQWVGSDL